MAVHRLAGWVERLEQQSRPTRIAALIVVHLAVFAVAYLGAFAFRFDFQVPEPMREAMWQGLPVIVAVKTGVFASLKMFQGWWRYVSLYDVIAVAHALAIGSIVFFGVHYFAVRPEAFARSIYLLDFVLSLVLLAGIRGSLRLVREAVATHGTGRRPRNLLIVGAGDLGDLLVREITRGQHLRYRPVAFLDHQVHKQGLRLHGIPIEGPLDRLEEVVEAYHVEEIIIALPPEDQHRIRHVVDRARRCEIQPRILPAVEAMLDGDVSLRRVREVSITDLLGRKPVELDVDSIARFVEGRTVMVTGAGGSIGSELCRQVARFGPSRLVMVDCAETPLFDVHRQLAEHHRDNITAQIANVTDRQRMRNIFRDQTPEIVLHAAAYKHVPLMESNPAEAVKNNVTGTRVVADTSAAYGVDTFVLISTDKAVNPTSVMGATKRITELYIQQLGRQTEQTRFCSVRFGNVLGSNGSVVPIFREQIRRGGPVTVTHPDMTRYFMTIPEAVQLVLQAAAFDNADDLFILDMGEPVQIAELARDMIRLSGMSEEEIPIVYTGIRPGEKLYEELALDREVLDTTSHAKIFVGRWTEGSPSDFDVRFQALLRAANLGDDARVRRLLNLLIPGYRGSDPRAA